MGNFCQPIAIASLKLWIPKQISSSPESVPRLDFPEQTLPKSRLFAYAHV